MEDGMNEESLRTHVLFLLSGEGAHIGFDKVINDFPANLRGIRVPDVPYTAWQLLEHMRIAQWDILEFSRNPKHVSPDYPEGYWPKEDGPKNENAWEKSIQSIRSDLKAVQELVEDHTKDLLSPLPHGSGQTLLREALLVADHNSYHIGQIALLRRLLGCPTDE
jgi:uncharacterized damage-inducible protein DinB